MSARKSNTSSRSKKVKTSIQVKKFERRVRKEPKAVTSAKTGRGTKIDRLLGLLRQPAGASIRQMAEELGWQPHSIRGVISGTLKKKLGLTVVSEKAAGKETVYRITNGDR